MNAKSGLSLTLSLALAPWGAAAERWSLEFGNDTPQQLVLEDAKGKLQFYWYLLYWVKNPGTKPVRPQLNLTMKLTLGKDEKTYADGYNTQAELYLEKKVFRRKVCNWAEVRAKPLEPNEKREGVALFHLGTEMPDFDLMEIMVRGLAEPRFVGRQGNVRKFRRSTLLLTYRYVPSRWRAGKELKYVPERWILEEVEVADRTLTEGQASDDVSKRLRELLKKAEEARKKKPTSRAKPPPTEGDASKSRQELIAIRYSPGSPAPQLLAALRELMTRPPAIRATFRETVGRGPRAQHASGTIVVERSGRFTMERLPRLAGRSTIKELRVFDGRSLWVRFRLRGQSGSGLVSILPGAGLSGGRASAQREHLRPGGSPGERVREGPSRAAGPGGRGDGVGAARPLLARRVHRLPAQDGSLRPRRRGHRAARVS